MSKPILVIKFGTSVITNPKGEVDVSIISQIAEETAALHSAYRIIIVSSGAVAAGKAYIPKFKGTITQRKAAAAVGNPLLIGIYASQFRPHGITIAQGLCERRHFSSRAQFLQLKATFDEIWANGIIPVVNENDTVSDRELKFSDNDELAALLSAGFGAKTLMFCTSSGGLLDENQKIIPKPASVDEAFTHVHAGKSALGLGGMTSKLTFAKRATRLGIQVIIFGVNGKNFLRKALNGESGTSFKSSGKPVSARNRWLGSAGMAVGKIWVDDGAAAALENRKSLLALGIRRVEGDFVIGEIMEILTERGDLLALARARASAADIRENLKTVNFEVAHANDIVFT